MMQIEKSTCHNHHHNNCYRAMSQWWRLKLLGKDTWENRIPVYFKLSPHKILTNYKGEKCKFTVQKTNKLCLSYVIKLTTTRNKACQHHLPPYMTHWGHTIASGVFLPKMSNLNFIMKKHQTNPNWTTILKLTGHHSSEMSRS